MIKPMLAKDADLAKVRFPLIVQPKLDGIRAMVVNGKLVSRTLKPIPNAAIRSVLERPEYEGLDGELIVGNPTDPKCYNRSVSFVMSESKTGEPWTFYAFDKWSASGGYVDRMINVAQSEQVRLDRVQWVDSYPARDADELMAREAELVEQGHEGVIARVPDAPYKFGRSGKTGPLLKIKRFVDFEAEVIGVYEEQHNGNAAKRNALGRTERSSHAAGKSGKGTLGGLVLRAINGDFAGTEFRCGTGFTASMRDDLWHEAIQGYWFDDEGQERSGLDGQIAKVKYFPIGSKDKPRHPVFLGWRNKLDM